MLTVTSQRTAATSPHFNVELQDTIALENEKVEFTVHVVAIPQAKIAWYKDGFEIFSSRRMKIVTENDQSTFIIHQAALEDEGEIKCTATNRAGHSVTKAILKLEGRTILHSLHDFPGLEFSTNYSTTQNQTSAAIRRRTTI